MIFFNERGRVLDTIKIANKSKKIINDSVDTLKEIEMPSDFECSHRIKESITILDNIIKNIDKTNGELDIKVEEFCAVQKKHIKSGVIPNYHMKLSAFSLNSAVSTYASPYGISYERLASMDNNKLIKLLGNKILNSPILQHLQSPLDENNSEIYGKARNNKMFDYIYRIVNRFTDESSVCQGGAYLDNNTIAYCDIDTKEDKGYLRIISKSTKYDKIKKVFDRTGTEVSYTKIEGHSNDITYIPEDRTILHIDNKNDVVDVFKIDNNYKITKTKTIDDIKADEIAYDKELQKIVVINATDAKYYSKNSFLEKTAETKPESNFKITDKVKDEKNSTYYNYIQGTAAHDGLLYIAYSGFDTDKKTYNLDRPVGNMIAICDYRKGGESVARIVDNIGVEIDDIDFDKDGDLVAFYNGGHWTRVFKTDLINSKTIAEEYKTSQNN